MERFTVVYEKDYSNYLFGNFPVIPIKSRILFDSGTDRPVIQFKLLNKGAVPVEKVFLRVELPDSTGEVLEETEHIILTSAGGGEFFGENSPLYVEDKRIAECRLHIVKAAFADGTVIPNEGGDAGEEVPPPQSIDFSGEVLSRFKAQAEKLKIRTDCRFEEQEKYWRCSCGLVNSAEVKSCPVCGADRQTLRTAFDEEELKKAAQNTIRRRKRIILISAAAAVCVLFFASYISYISKMRYLGNGDFPEFDENGYYICYDGGAYFNSETVIINRLGFEVFPDVQDAVYDPESGYLIKSGGLYGLADTNLEWKVKPMLREYPLFGENGLALVNTNEGWGVIDKQFMYVYGPYEGEKPEISDSEEVVKFFIDEKCGLIRGDGVVIAEPVYDEIRNFDSEISLVKQNKKYGLIDKSGTIIAEPAYDKITTFDSSTVKIMQNGKYGLLNKNGTLVVQPVYESIGTFKNDIAVVNKDGKYGLMDRNGKVITEVDGTIHSFSGNVAVLEQNKKLGIISCDGTFIVKPKFDKMEDFKDYDGVMLAQVTLDGKVGYIKEDGTYAAEPVIDASKYLVFDIKEVDYRIGNHYVSVQAFYYEYIDNSPFIRYKFFEFEKGKLTEII